MVPAKSAKPKTTSRIAARMISRVSNLRDIRAAPLMQKDDTFSASRGKRLYPVAKNHHSKSISSDLARLALTVHFAGFVVRASAGLPHVDSYCRRSDCPKHRNTGCACS